MSFLLDLDLFKLFKNVSQLITDQTYMFLIVNDF